MTKIEIENGQKYKLNNKIENGQKYKIENFENWIKLKLKVDKIEIEIENWTKLKWDKIETRQDWKLDKNGNLTNLKIGHNWNLDKIEKWI